MSMAFRLAALVSILSLSILVWADAPQPAGYRSDPPDSATSGTRSDNADGQSSQAGEQRRTKNARGSELQVPSEPGPHLAFDVRPADHRKTTRYVLEITHPSGKITTHDLEKPALQKRTIVIAIPKLPAGRYKIVVIAEIEGGAKARSRALPLEIPPA